MGFWAVPLIVVVVTICLISIVSVRKSSKLASLVDGRDEISESIEEHPFTLNPIIWVIAVAVVFIGIVIFYYAATSTSF